MAPGVDGKAVAVEARAEQAKVDARSAARDLLRLVRALEVKGVDMGTIPDEERRALDLCNQGLATALGEIVEHGERAPKPEDLDLIEGMIAESRARLQSTKQTILAGLGSRRREILEAMMAVEIAEEDLQVEELDQTELDAELDAARKRAEARLVAAGRSEKLRRRAEREPVDPAASLATLVAGLPSPWRRAIARATPGAEPEGAKDGKSKVETPAAVTQRVADQATLAARIAALRPGERHVLGALLDAGGSAPARGLEAKFGNADEDGFFWDREAPTSSLGRLRARGLCFVGRAAAGAGAKPERIVVVPEELREAIACELAACAAAARRQAPLELTIEADLIDEVLEAEENATAEEAETEAVRFDRAQPDLAWFAASAAEALGAGEHAVQMGATLVYFVERIWAMYEAAHPDRVPRLRRRDIERARRASEKEIEVIEKMHEKLLERRVETLVSTQPHLYAFLARALDDSDTPLDDEDKAIVFHACDTAIRAFDAVLAAT